MRKLRLADLKRTLWKRRGKKNELEKFMEETERKNREKRWKLREEMWRNEAGLAEKNTEENDWRKGMEKLVEVKEERKRAEKEKKLIKTKHMENKSDDEEWEKLETYVGEIEKCLEDEIWDEMNEPEEGENAQVMDRRGLKRIREEEDEFLVRDMKRLRLEDFGEKAKTGQTSEIMGEKIKNNMAYNHQSNKGQNQNPQNPQNEGLVPEKMKKISPQMENKMKKLTIVTSNREEGGKFVMRNKNDQRKTPSKGVVGKEKGEKLNRKEKGSILER